MLSVSSQTSQEMAQNRLCSVSQSFFTNLVLLGMDIENSDKKYGCTVSKDMFDAPNVKGMEAVLYFLLSKVSSEARDNFRALWPIVDKKQSRDFKTTCHNLLTKMEKNGCLPPNTTRLSHLHSCSGERFYILVWHLSNLALKTVMEAEKATVPDLPGYFDSHSPSLHGLLNGVPNSILTSNYEVIQRSTQLQIQIQSQKFVNSVCTMSKEEASWFELSSKLEEEYRLLSKSMSQMRQLKKEVEIKSKQQEMEGKYSEHFQRQLEQSSKVWGVLIEWFEASKSERDAIEQVYSKVTSVARLEGKELETSIKAAIERGYKFDDEKSQRNGSMNNVGSGIIGLSGGSVDITQLIIVWTKILKDFFQKIDNVKRQMTIISQTESKELALLLSSQSKNKENQLQTSSGIPIGISSDPLSKSCQNITEIASQHQIHLKNMSHLIEQLESSLPKTKQRVAQLQQIVANQQSSKEMANNLQQLLNSSNLNSSIIDNGSSNEAAGGKSGMVASTRKPNSSTMKLQYQLPNVSTLSHSVPLNLIPPTPRISQARPQNLQQNHLHQQQLHLSLTSTPSSTHRYLNSSISTPSSRIPIYQQQQSSSDASWFGDLDEQQLASNVTESILQMVNNSPSNNRSVATFGSSGVSAGGINKSNKTSETALQGISSRQTPKGNTQLHLSNSSNHINNGRIPSSQHRRHHSSNSIMPDATSTPSSVSGIGISPLNLSPSLQFSRNNMFQSSPLFLETKSVSPMQSNVVVNNSNHLYSPIPARSYNQTHINMNDNFNINSGIESTMVANMRKSPSPTPFVQPPSSSNSDHMYNIGHQHQTYQTQQSLPPRSQQSDFIKVPSRKSKLFPSSSSSSPSDSSILSTPDTHNPGNQLNINQSTSRNSSPLNTSSPRNPSPLNLSTTSSNGSSQRISIKTPEQRRIVEELAEQIVEMMEKNGNDLNSVQVAQQTMALIGATAQQISNVSNQNQFNNTHSFQRSKSNQTWNSSSGDAAGLATSLPSSTNLSQFNHRRGSSTGSPSAILGRLSSVSTRSNERQKSIPVLQIPANSSYAFVQTAYHQDKSHQLHQQQSLQDIEQQLDLLDASQTEENLNWSGEDSSVVGHDIDVYESHVCNFSGINTNDSFMEQDVGEMHSSGNWDEVNLSTSSRLESNPPYSSHSPSSNNSMNHPKVNPFVSEKQAKETQDEREFALLEHQLSQLDSSINEPFVSSSIVLDDVIYEDHMEELSEEAEIEETGILTGGTPPSLDPQTEFYEDGETKLEQDEGKDYNAETEVDEDLELALELQRLDELDRNKRNSKSLIDDDDNNEALFESDDVEGYYNAEDDHQKQEEEAENAFEIDDTELISEVVAKDVSFAYDENVGHKETHEMDEEISNMETQPGEEAEGVENVETEFGLESAESHPERSSLSSNRSSSSFSLSNTMLIQSSTVVAPKLSFKLDDLIFQHSSPAATGIDSNLPIFTNKNNNRTVVIDSPLLSTGASTTSSRSNVSPPSAGSSKSLPKNHLVLLTPSLDQHSNLLDVTNRTMGGTGVEALELLPVEVAVSPLVLLPTDQGDLIHHETSSTITPLRPNELENLNISVGDFHDSPAYDFKSPALDSIKRVLKFEQF